LTSLLIWNAAITFSPILAVNDNQGASGFIMASFICFMISAVRAGRSPLDSIKSLI